MATITLTIDRADVYEEVAKATDYTGSKLTEGGEDARERILMSDADQAELGRFWQEAVSTANERLKEMYESGSLPSETPYTATLKVSVNYDTALTPSVQASLRSFFVNFITGKWYVYANKAETKDYFEEAAGLMEDVRRKLYTRKMPLSPRRRFVGKN